MTERDSGRKKAKMLRKIRWYYVHFMQEKKRKLCLYRSYRHYTGHQKDCYDFKDCDFYMTKEVHPGAGIGDQLASWISGYYYADSFGVKYAYSRFYPDRWEQFLGFGRGEEYAADLIQNREYKKVILPWFDEESISDDRLIHNIMASYQGQKIVFFLELNQIYTAQYGAMNAVRDKFNKSHPPIGEALLYKPDELSIAVHIRRGDIAGGQLTGKVQLTQRWLNNDYYVTILNQLLPLLEGKKTAVYLFSQGTKDEFKEFERFGPVHYCMDMPATASFLHMVRADILITGKSSFSYKPALLSEGIRISPKNFWHEYPKLRSWVLAEDTGQLNLEDIKSALQEMQDNKKDKG